MPRFLGIGRDKLELKRIGIKSSNAGFMKNLLWTEERHYVYIKWGKKYIIMESSSSVIVDINKKQIIQLSNGVMFISFHIYSCLPLIHGGYVPRPPSRYLKPQIPKPINTVLSYIHIIMIKFNL